MSYDIQATILGTEVACRTEGRLVCLNDLVLGFNMQRAQKRQAAMQLSAVLVSSGLQAYKEEAATVWGIDADKMVQQIKYGAAKNQSRTFAHISIALYIAEIASPAFHAAMHKEFVDGRLLQFREQGGTEFKNLNAAIDKFLPGREAKSSNQGLYINAAKMIRSKIVNLEDEGVWDRASAAQQQRRTEVEQALVSMLRMDLVRDWDHLKDLIVKV